MNKYIKYVGLDVHKDTIAVAIAKALGKWGFSDRKIFSEID